MVLKLGQGDMHPFENDVKTYSIRTILCIISPPHMFESDVKVYGIQTVSEGRYPFLPFENDVKCMC